MEETSMNQIKSINQYSILISIELSQKYMPVQSRYYINEFRLGAGHFENLEYLNSINIQYFEILCIVTERGLQKLHPSDLIDVSF